MDTVTAMLWFYVAVMVLGALLFAGMAQNRRGVPGYEYAIAIFIPVWSGGAYLAMALGQGQLIVNGETVYIARYLDWVVTTPLLLMALALTAMIHSKKEWTLILALMGADVVMIISGLLADLSGEGERYLWYGIGVVAFLVILYLVWVPVRAQSRLNPDARIAAVYDRVAAFLTVLWILYPVAWIIGPSGLALVSREVEMFLFVVVPILSKVGFSLYDLTLLRGLNTEDRSTTHAYSRAATGS